MKIWMKRGLLVLLAAAVLTACGTSLEDSGAYGNLTDGTYMPDSFSFSGGSGRASIDCPKVTIRNGQAYAELIFDSGSYSYVKIEDKTYQGENTEDASVFEVPVRLNQENTVIGCTTKMSMPHEITYNICVYIEDASDSSSGVSSKTEKEMSKDAGKYVDSAAGGSGEKAWQSGSAPLISGLTFESELQPEFAEDFVVYRYSDDFRVIEIKDGGSYLVVPEGKKIPDDLPEKMVVLQRPLNHIYVAGTATMAMFQALDGLLQVKFSSLQAEDWHIDAAKKAMEAGEIEFAGKYSEPDYEMLVDEGCDLAVESQMIYHSPKVMEMLQMMDIPVFVDCSSNEEHPLGRTEWIKVYGVLLDREEEADAFFEEQTEVLDELERFSNTEKSVVYFYINSSGQAVVRTGTDYITKMIEIAGGRYPFESLAKESGSSAVITMEEFYAAAADADYLIYNASIDGKLNTVEDLIAKDEVLKDMKAVREGNVFCTDKDFYQAADIASRMISDIHIMLTNGNEDEMTFLYRVKE